MCAFIIYRDFFCSLFFLSLIFFWDLTLILLFLIVWFSIDALTKYHKHKFGGESRRRASVDGSRGVGQLLLSQGLQVHLFPCRSCFSEATRAPWLWDPFSRLQSQHQSPRLSDHSEGILPCLFSAPFLHF